ncbi:hypothetical protein PVK64_13130 [Aliivibrio sp. S4TY2]|uniref:Uncharacterized protein n=1 Tax=Aliivibrio finisterrensis TaxID=511998 RepID=A0A4Q5KEH4_9GAMM|nr:MULTISPECIES: hypothetical protein [Aliivibrio]MDD9157121.1 hypothetical protein [Aliivibrio sp. S4TY2]MDD9161046.1 hypothetical protein [Aliivibrio sp. S4TY1]MDD9165033.1 hypothetical protein [Aliivibrio sp. S4MY2]MDD9169074.1 hypothetical protein [Aliivibrio sp. S4MY4]MDD9176360.1 hypothetical protein [Aliivibrio sp. S3TY1]
MNNVDKSSNLLLGNDQPKALCHQKTPVDETVNTWDLLTDEQQQEILSHLSEIPFQ